MLQPLSPLSRLATNFLSVKTQILSLTVSYKRTQTKTNNCTTIYLRSQYTLFATTLHIFLSLLSYIAVPNYHRRSLRNYRSDQIEQSNFLTSNKRISTISPVLALVLVATAWTTTKFPTYVSFRSILKATTTQGYDNNNNNNNISRLQQQQQDFFGIFFSPIFSPYLYLYLLILFVFVLVRHFDVATQHLCFGLRAVLSPKQYLKPQSRISVSPELVSTQFLLINITFCCHNSTFVFWSSRCIAI